MGHRWFRSTLHNCLGNTQILALLIMSRLCHVGSGHGALITIHLIVVFLIDRCYRLRSVAMGKGSSSSSSRNLRQRMSLVLRKDVSTPHLHLHDRYCCMWGAVVLLLLVVKAVLLLKLLLLLLLTMLL